MREGYFLNSGEQKESRKGSKLMKALLFCSGLLLSMNVVAQNTAPTFVNGARQGMSVCANIAPRSINSLLTVTDPDVGQTQIWSVIAGPLHGTLGGFNTADTATGAPVSPSGLTYQPTTGYSGLDSFSVIVSDSFDFDTTTIIVTVNPSPTLNSTRTPASICDGAFFNYTPTSATGGVTFTWSRSFTGGISTPSTTGTGNIREVLNNSTNYTVPVTYVYNLTAGGCAGPAANVVVNVHPTPRLSSKLNDTICGGSAFTYVPTTPTSGTTFTWSRAAVGGIDPATSAGTGNINEVLTNSASGPVSVIYAFMLSANGCTSTRNVNVLVNPSLPATGIVTNTPSTACAGMLYQNFSAATTIAGAAYTWHVYNATLAGTGSTGNNILVHFNNPGTVLITLTYGAGSNCVVNDSFEVIVGNNQMFQPAAVIYTNSQFVYLDNTVNHYQWGYEEKNTLQPIIPGIETFQSYVNSTPDFSRYYYWVRVTKNGCTQKIYYNAPTATANTVKANATLEVYPNPATSTVTVNMEGMQSATTEFTVINIFGQTVKTRSGSANSIQFDIADLPAGCYMINCTQDGVKVASARFIKG